MKKKDALMEQIARNDAEQIRGAWNAWMLHSGQTQYININDIAEFMRWTLWDVERLSSALKKGDYQSRESYMYIDDDGGLISFDEILGFDSPVNTSEIADYLAEVGDEFGLVSKDGLIYEFKEEYFPELENVGYTAKWIGAWMDRNKLDIVKDDWDKIAEQLKSDLS